MVVRRLEQGVFAVDVGGVHRLLLINSFSRQQSFRSRAQCSQILHGVAELGSCASVQ